jgi:DNA-binding NarL/FixJ family response regulator
MLCFDSGISIQRNSSIGLAVSGTLHALPTGCNLTTCETKRLEIRGNGDMRHRQRVYLVVAVKAWAQLLGDRIERIPEFEVIGSAPDAGVALADLERLDAPAGIVVIDVGTPLALQTAAALLRSDTTQQLVAVALEEDPGHAIAWASTGAIGLVGRTASLDELLHTLTEAAGGEPSCSAAISGALLRGISSVDGRSRNSHSATQLTGRELEVAWLVAGGFTNREIATRLQISHGTAKSHVHSVIRKLGVARRAHVASKLPQSDCVPTLALHPRIPSQLCADSAPADVIR